MFKLFDNRVVQAVLAVLTALYFFLVIASLSPKTEWSKRVNDSVEDVWNYLRLDQNWALFSPEIRAINYHTTAVVTFTDGTRMIWELPRAHESPLPVSLKMKSGESGQ